MSHVNQTERFKLSAKMVKQLSSTHSNTELLMLYGAYKQATVGDCNIEEPSKIYLKENTKWQFWNKLKNMSKDDAMRLYSDHAMKMIEKYGVAQ